MCKHHGYEVNLGATTTHTGGGSQGQPRRFFFISNQLHQLITTVITEKGTKSTLEYARLHA